MTPQEFDAVHDLMTRIENPVIVELGAYRGEDTYNFENMVDSTPNLVHVMVEPDTENCRFIEGNRHRPFGPHRRLICGAIADSRGHRMFRRSRDSRDGACGSGSILEPTGHKEHFPSITFEVTQPVECFTLDEIFERENLPKIDLLWVDIQGAEREMIIGGTKALARTRYCFMEAEEVELYAGQALKPELIAMLQPTGWKLIQDFGFNILLENERFQP
jgi:FkbM family methyltransferase